MNTAELRTLQAPLKEKYKEAPETALVTLKAQGRVGEGEMVPCRSIIIDNGQVRVEGENNV